MKFLLTLILSLISFGVLAECPYSIKDATVMLSLEGKTNLKITSSAMCNQKFYFADRFFDADIELWKSGKLVGKFYSRRVSYDPKSLKLVLQNMTFLSSDVVPANKMDKVTILVMDLKQQKLSSNLGVVHF